MRPNGAVRPRRRPRSRRAARTCRTCARYRRPRDDLRPLLREQLAVLPVADHHAARAVRPQHRRVDERRRQRRVRAGPRERRRAGHRRHLAARAGYRTALIGKYLNGYPNGAATDVRPPRLDDVGQPGYGQPVLRVRLHAQREPHDSRVRQHQPRDYGTDVYVEQDRPLHPRRGARPEQAVLRLPRGVRAAPARRPRRRATPDVPATRRRRARRASTRPTSATSRAACATCRRSRRRDQRRSTRSTASGSGRCRRSTAASPRSCTRCGAPGSSTTPTSCSRRTTASTSASTACRRASRPPYETDIHVPLLVRGPGVRAGAHVDPARRQHRPGADVRGDGRGRAPVVHRRPFAAPAPRAAPASAWRTAYLVGAPGRDRCDPTGTRHAGGALDPRAARPRPGRARRPTPRTGRSATPCCERGAEIPDYDGVRTAGASTWSTPTATASSTTCAHDPDEIHNLAGTRPALERGLAHRIARQRSGAAGACPRGDSRLAFEQLIDKVAAGESGGAGDERQTGHGAPQLRRSSYCVL